MNRAVKIAIGIASVGVTATIAYLIIKKIQDSRDAEKGNEGGEVTPPANAGSGDDNSNKPTPFKNKAQGDAFRHWVNRYYPSYAKQIDLSLTGDIDNSFMRKAWGKYGETYKKGNPNFLKVSASSIPSNLLKTWELRKDKGLIGNNSEGAIYLRTSLLGKIDNKDVYAYFYSNGKVSFTKGGVRLSYNNWSDSGKKIYIDKKTYTGTDYFNTAYKVFEDAKKFQETASSINSYSGLPITPTFPFNGNLKSDLDAPARKGIDLDLNIND